MSTTTPATAHRAVRRAAPALRGELITPADPGYDEARAVYNAMIDSGPAAIARCRDAADVVACVRFARAHDLDIAVRGGGHNAGGLGVVGRRARHRPVAMRSVTVDPRGAAPSASTAAAPGVTSTTPPSPSAWPRRPGFIATTGVGGLTLGGGIGYLARRYGLTVDNLLSADVVLADGTFVTASENSHPDLFWALRGGGGNFGVVTSFTFRCHPIGEGGVDRSAARSSTTSPTPPR